MANPIAKFRYKIIFWLLRFLQIQLFITTMSLPVLVWWGLPISLLSPLGNLLFLPFLTVFLMLCSIIFFLEIAALPNGWFIYILEIVTSWWDKALTLGTGTQYLVGFSKPPLLFVLLIPLTSLFIVQNRYTKQLHRSILALTLLLGLSFLYLKLIRPTSTFIETIPYKNELVTLIKSKNQTIVIDPGCIGKKSSAQSWVEYTLAPNIIQKTGKNGIDHLIVLKLGIITFNYIEKLCSLMSIKTVYMPYWEGTLHKNGWRSFFFMRRALEKNGTKLVRIGKKPITVTFPEEKKLLITPLDKRIAYHDSTYPTCIITGQIANQTIYIQNSSTKKSI